MDNFNNVNELENNETVAVSAGPVNVKGNKIQKPILIGGIILIAMVVLMAVGFICFKFLTPTVTGTWIVDTEAMYSTDASSQSPESLTYYVFNDDGSASMAVGTMKVVGTWEYHDTTGIENADGTYIDVSISSFFNGTYHVQVDGNGFVGSSMTLVPADYSTLQLDQDSQNVVFKSASAPSLEVEPFSHFKFNEKVVGEWECEANNTKYTFREDGTCFLNQMDSLFIDGAYSVEDEKIEIKYLAASETNTSFEYTIVDDDTITISGLEYKKVK